MIWKLSVTGIKSRLRDYMVLFFGLFIAAAIFYMFQSMASNKEFLESSSTISSIVLIFKIGSVLLSIITMVYILYANSFLMIIRQKTYAMFMMLGARTGKIAQIIFLETFIIGIIATVIGVLVGIGLTSVVSSILIKQLSLSIQHFSAFNMKGLIETFVFFLILFALAAIINALSIIKKPILQLLKEQSTPKMLVVQPSKLVLETVLGVLSLGVGYYMIAEINTYKIGGIIVGIIGVVLGSYLLFHAVSIFVLSLLKEMHGFSMRKINNFILSQLTFRIREYTQILTMVAILFALAMGAIVVGLGFRDQGLIATNKENTFDLILNNAQLVDENKVNALNPTTNLIYSLKEDDTTVYYKTEEFNEHPLLNKNSKTSETLTYNSEELTEYPEGLDALRLYETPEQQQKEINLVSDEQFDELPYEKTTLQLVSVDDFIESIPDIKELVAINHENNPSIESSSIFYVGNQKYEMYLTMGSVYSGFQFMGFFLGIAFLTMLASCLMFKILSSANNDTVKYQMLRKIGTRQSLLKGAIRKEIGVLFILPGALGIIHVLFGLQLFKGFLDDPYNGIWLPIVLFVLVYFIYYLVTITIYASIVLPKKK